MPMHLFMRSEHLHHGLSDPPFLCFNSVMLYLFITGDTRPQHDQADLPVCLNSTCAGDELLLLKNHNLCDALHHTNCAGQSQSRTVHRACDYLVFFQCWFLPSRKSCTSVSASTRHMGTRRREYCIGIGRSSSHRCGQSLPPTVRRTDEWCVAVAISIFTDKCSCRQKARRRRSRRRRNAFLPPSRVPQEGNVAGK